MTQAPSSTVFSQMPITVAIIDNDVWSMQSIAQWLSAYSMPGVAGRPFHIAWTATNPAQGLQKLLIGKRRLDALLIDMALGATNGVALTRAIAQQRPMLPVIGITAYDPEKYTAELCESGGRAVIAKDCLTRDLPSVIIQAVQNPPCLSTPEPSLDRVAVVKSDKESISPRELQVLRLYDQGFDSREIAAKLGISLNSVFTYVRRAGKKLGVTGRVKIIRKCKDFDLI